MNIRYPLYEGVYRILTYNSKKDVAFYTSSRIKHYSADAGSFFLFFPSDIHQPSVRGKGELVKSRKIVIKIEYVD